MLKNVGSVENKGVELGIGVNLGNKVFRWNANANISINRNKVLKLAEADRFFGPSIGNMILRNGGAATMVMEGEPIGVFWGNIFDGIWQTQEEVSGGHMAGNSNARPGFENFRDFDGNGIFEEGKDETVVGNPHPDFTFGFNNSFQYKNFDLSFSINGVVGNDVLNLNLIRLTGQINQENAIKEYVNAWNGPGTSNKYFVVDRPDGRSADFPQRVATHYIEDGTFVRLQNVTLGYNIPSQLIENLRVYFAADNWITLTKYSGYNPEVSAAGNTSTALGIDLGTYPAAKTLRFGVKIDF